MSQKVELQLEGRTVSIETGRLAKQADGAVLISTGDTILLCTATMNDQVRESIDFFPLICDYEERKYSVGKIPGGFVKRGGKPSERAILISRLIDRPLRPLFPTGMRNEVQIIVSPLSVGLDNPPDVLAINGASAALSISRIPFDGPVGAVRISKIEGNLVINPSWEETKTAEFSVIIAGEYNSITTLDVEANQADETDIIEAINYGQEAIRQMIALQEELVRVAGQPKSPVELYRLPDEIVNSVRERAGAEIIEAITQSEKQGRQAAIAEIIDRLCQDFPEQELEVAEAVEKICKEEVRKLILNSRIRPDGRKPDEIRAVSSEVGLLPRTHGSGLFTRGQTQVLTTVTLGSLEDAQIVDTLEEDTVKRYMHYYNFPPFSVGEARPLRAPGRREVGHGALAEKALLPVIPSMDDFPYALLLTSEVLESNGSTSMASVCSCTLALMDAGVNIKAPIAGVAMGLMTNGDEYVILSDILDMEDFYGDMDFKVAGSANGITAIQLDTKIPGIPLSLLPDILTQAKQVRQQILNNMLETISEPRPELSPYAPRVLIIEIHPDKIGEVIGPGGRVIKKIEAETGASLSIEQDGRVFITAVDKAASERARKMVDDITRDIKVGETYVGRVTKTTNFGAFVEILPGREGLVHISQMSPKRVERVEDIMCVGDEVIVKVTEIGPQGKIALTRKGIEQLSGEAQHQSPTPPAPKPPQKSSPPQRPPTKPPNREQGGFGDTPQVRFRPKR